MVLLMENDTLTKIFFNKLWQSTYLGKKVQLYYFILVKK